MNKKLSEFSTLSGVTNKDIILNGSLVPCIYKKGTDRYYTNANFKISEYFPSKDSVNTQINDLNKTVSDFITSSTATHNTKLDKNQGLEKANRILITNPSGEIIFTGTAADCLAVGGIAATISTIESNIGALSTTTALLTTKVVELEESIGTSSGTTGGLQEQIDILDDEIESLTFRVENDISTLQTLANNAMSLSSSVESIVTQLSSTLSNSPDYASAIQITDSSSAYTAAANGYFLVTAGGGYACKVIINNITISNANAASSHSSVMVPVAKDDSIQWTAPTGAYFIPYKYTSY